MTLEEIEKRIEELKLEKNCYNFWVVTFELEKLEKEKRKLTLGY